MLSISFMVISFVLGECICALGSLLLTWINFNDNNFNKINCHTLLSRSWSTSNSALLMYKDQLKGGGGGGGGGTQAMCWHRGMYIKVWYFKKRLKTYYWFHNKNMSRFPLWSGIIRFVIDWFSLLQKQSALDSLRKHRKTLFDTIQQLFIALPFSDFG